MRRKHVRLKKIFIGVVTAALTFGTVSIAKAEILGGAETVTIYDRNAASQAVGTTLDKINKLIDHDKSKLFDVLGLGGCYSVYANW